MGTWDYLSNYELLKGMQMAKVVMAESSEIYRDGRVLKEAGCLAANGYEVTIYGFRSDVGAKSAYPFKIVTLPIFSRKKRFLRNLSMALNIFLINLKLLFTRADVYHAHNTMFLVGAYLSSRLRRAKFIYDCHEVQFEAGCIQGLLERVLINKANAIINVSKGRAEYQRQQYRLGNRDILMIHNYPEAFHNDRGGEDAAEQNKCLRIVFSGGYNVTDNRLDNFVRMLVGVEHVCLDLIAFGYGDSSERLLCLVRELDLTGKINFLPLVPFKDLIPTIAKYDIAVDMLTNPENKISKQYPAVNKIYEYLSAGLPVICSNLESIKEEIAGQDLGVSLDPDDIENGRRQIIALRDDKKRLLAMRDNVERVARNKYNWKSECEKLLGLYSELL